MEVQPMPRKLVDCPHCHGKKTCTASGGRSCHDCLKAAGRSVKQWGTVRCSQCGGRGKMWVEEEEAPETAEQAVAEAGVDAAADSPGASAEAAPEA
jgi:hypothetical protein